MTSSRRVLLHPGGSSRKSRQGSASTSADSALSPACFPSQSPHHPLPLSLPLYREHRQPSEMPQQSAGPWDCRIQVWEWGDLVQQGSVESGRVFKEVEAGVLNHLCCRHVPLITNITRVTIPDAEPDQCQNPRYRTPPASNVVMPNATRPPDPKTHQCQN